MGEVRLAVPRPCNSCSIIDPLSHKFCVNCGSGMVMIDRSNHMLSSDVSIKPKGKTTTRKMRANKRKSNNLTAVVAGILLIGTITAGIYSLCQYQLSQSTGVLIHAMPIGSEVTIEDHSGFVVKTGLINRRGEVQLVGFQPGIYSLAISHVGFKTSSQELNIMPNKIAALGIPISLQLKRETDDSEEKDSNTFDSKPDPRIEPSLNTKESKEQSPEPKPAEQTESSSISSSDSDLNSRAVDKVPLANPEKLLQQAAAVQTAAIQAAAAAQAPVLPGEQGSTATNASTNNSMGQSNESSLFAGENQNALRRKHYANIARRYGMARRMGMSPWGKEPAQLDGLENRTVFPDPNEAPAPVR